MMEKGFCMLLGEPCDKKCPHYYYRKTNGCYKEFKEGDE